MPRCGLCEKERGFQISTKRVVSILRRPIPRFFRRSGASLCGSFPEHPSAPAVVPHPHGPTARIIPFPAPQEPISAARYATLVAGFAPTTMLIVAGVLSQRRPMRNALVLLAMTALLSGRDTLSFDAAILVAAVMAIINAVLWPLLIRIALPLTIVTFGLGSLALSAGMVALAFYALAKLLEVSDAPIYRATHGMMSGHALKHVAAALAAYWLLRMLQRRVPRASAVATNPS